MPSFLHRLIAPRTRPVVESETMVVELAGGRTVRIVRVRHPRARRIKLSVNERGVRLTLPMRASLRAGDAFVHAHRDWIAGQLSRWTGAVLPGAFVRGCASVPLRGNDVAVFWEDGRYASARREGEAIVVALPASAGDAAARRALREYYLAEARADVGLWLPRYLPTFPRAPSAIRIRPMSSLWGSLSARDALSLDLALVLGAPGAFEYVLVHELCHLVHRHHRGAFWREVEARGVDWRAQRDYLHEQGHALKSALAHLVGSN